MKLPSSFTGTPAGTQGVSSDHDAQQLLSVTVMEAAVVHGMHAEEHAHSR